MTDEILPGELPAEAGLGAGAGERPVVAGLLGGPEGGEGPEPAFTAVEDWVLDHFLPVFRRALGGEFRWCAQWWQHAEAVSRLTALWHAWEVLRLQPGTGIAIWYRDHLDHQLPVLMGARGPFCQCTETAHREPRMAAAVPAPEDWWDAGAGDLPAARLPGLPGTSAEGNQP